MCGRLMGTRFWDCPPWAALVDTRPEMAILPRTSARITCSANSWAAIPHRHQREHPIQALPQYQAPLKMLWREELAEIPLSHIQLRPTPRSIMLWVGALWQTGNPALGSCLSRHRARPKTRNLCGLPCLGAESMKGFLQRNVPPEVPQVWTGRCSMALLTA